MSVDAAASATARTLAVRMGVGQSAEPVHALLAKKTRGWRSTGVATARQGSAMDLTYSVIPADGEAAGLVLEMNGVTGVQSVDLRLSDG